MALRRQVVRLIRRPDLLARLRRGITPVKSIVEEAQPLAGMYRSLVMKMRAAERNRSSPAFGDEV